MLYYLEPKGPILPKFPVKDEPDYGKFKDWEKSQNFDIPEDKAYLRYKCIEGFTKTCVDFSIEKKKEYWGRVKNELNILEDKDFSSYMLIVADYTNWAKKVMPVGPARGSRCWFFSSLPYWHNFYQPNGLWINF